MSLRAVSSQPATNENCSCSPCNITDWLLAMTTLVSMAQCYKRWVKKSWNLARIWTGGRAKKSKVEPQMTSLGFEPGAFEPAWYLQSLDSSAWLTSSAFILGSWVPLLEPDRVFFLPGSNHNIAHLWINLFIVTCPGFGMASCSNYG